jgi:AcrR family transcriptional regulator
MTEQTTVETVRPRRGAETRAHILDIATRHFYLDGLHAVSADRIIAEAGISKVTFYRHFPSKDDLIVAYLERRAAWERSAVEGARASAKGDTDETLRLISMGIGAESCSPGFRGCPFINAAAEYPDAAHPIRQVVDAHRVWFKAAIREMVQSAGVSDVDTVVDEIVMLRDGAMVGGYLGDPETVGRALYNASRAVLHFTD